MKINFSLFVLLVTLLAGCATTQPISSADKAAVTAVVLSETIPVPEKMYYLGPGGGIGIAFGIIGAALTASSTEEERANFQKQAAEGEEAIRDIVKEEVLAQMRTSGKFPFVDAGTPGAQSIQISVSQYGFSIPHGFSSQLVPILGIKCEMVDGTGRVLWSGKGNTMPLGNPVESVDAETIRKDIGARNAAWRAAAKALAKNIVESY